MLNKLLNESMSKKAESGALSFVEEHPTATSATALGLALTEYLGDAVNAFRKSDPALRADAVANAIQKQMEREGVKVSIKDSYRYRPKYNPKKRLMTIDAESARIPEFLAHRYGGEVYEKSLTPGMRNLVNAAKIARRVSKFAPLATMLLVPHDMYGDTELGGALMNAASVGALLSSPIVMHRELKAIGQAKKIIEEAALKSGTAFNRNPLRTLRPGLLGQAISSAAMVLVPQLLKERMKLED